MVGRSRAFSLSDALGSVLASFSNAAGIAAIKDNQVFGPYGNARDVQGTINTAKGFTGQYNDSLTRLDYYGSRYYDQVVGVFLSADTVQGNGSGENPYGYVGGNPETYSDPSGQMEILPGEGGGGELGGGFPEIGNGGVGPCVDTGGSSGDVGTGSIIPSGTQATVGNTTYTLDPATGEVTVHVVNADGSEEWFRATSGTEEYNQAMQAFNSGIPDEGASAVVQGDVGLSHAMRNEITERQVSEPETSPGQGNQPPINNRPPAAPPPEGQGVPDHFASWNNGTREMPNKMRVRQEASFSQTPMIWLAPLSLMSYYGP